MRDSLRLVARLMHEASGIPVPFIDVDAISSSSSSSSSSSKSRHPTRQHTANGRQGNSRRRLGFGAPPARFRAA